VLRGGVALVERGGNISGLAWRYANSLEQDTGPLGWECRGEMQSQLLCRSVCMCMSVKSAAA
jgi:hypothetical protein